MDKVLSVVIPYFNETKEDMFPTLASIAGQSGVDFGRIECIMVNDGSNNVLSEDFLALFRPLCVRCIFLDKNGGPGVARQAGAEAAAGEYVIFCDADDVFHNVLVFRAILDEIETSHPDVVHSEILMERYDAAADKFIYVPNGWARHLLHGKAYRRAYLRANDVRFHPELRLFEDTYFNGLVFAGGLTAVYIDKPCYLRKHRAGSLTRADDPAYFLEILPDYIGSIGALCRALDARRSRFLSTYVIRFTAYFYFTLTKRHWQHEGWKPVLSRAEQAFREQIGPFIEHFRGADAETVKAAYDENRALYFVGETESESIGEWVDKVCGVAPGVGN
jgi:glycosyltransferase involved in cell wall biosynthesis